MNITKRIVPESKYALKCPYAMTPTKIVVHNTANDASAENEISYMTTNNLEKSFHYAVDDLGVVQGLEENRNGWHAGDGNGAGNRYGIGVEICYSKSGGDRFIKSEQNAAELIADILKRHDWGIDRVAKHQDYSGKYCPHRTLDMGWQRFLNMITDQLNGSTETPSTSGTWARCTGNGVNVRSGAGMGFKVLRQLNKGNDVLLISQVGEWFKVDVEGLIGYVHSDYISASIADDSESSDTPKVATGTVTGVNVNVRSGPGTEYTKKFKVTKGNSLNIIQEQGGWYEINCLHGNGWITSEFVSID